jgi:hypothetical protein
MGKDATLSITGADTAIIGLVSRCGDVPIIIYDSTKLLKHFVKQGMTEDEAEEWIVVNVEGAWVGRGTPGVLRKGTADQIREILQ